MKRILALLAVTAMAFGLTSCQVQATTDGPVQGFMVDYRRFCQPQSLELDIYNRGDFPVNVEVTFGKSLTTAHFYGALPDDGIPWELVTDTTQASVNVKFIRTSDDVILHTFTEPVTSCG
jgi:hypothetical protein